MSARMLRRAIATLAAIAWARSEDAEMRIPIRSEEGRRLQASPEVAAFSDGEGSGRPAVRLEAIHMHRLESDAIVHVRHPVDYPETGPNEGRRLDYTGTTTRDLIQLMAKLSILAYGTNGPYKEAVMTPILDAGWSLFGNSISTYAEEEQAGETTLTDLMTEIEGVGTLATVDPFTPSIDASGVNSQGVHALEFTATGLGAVLAFRGSYSDGDFDNIKPWITEWILKRQTAQQKTQWIDKAGLEWTDQMERDSRSLDLGAVSNTIVAGGSWYFSNQFLDDMAQKARDTTDPTIDENKVRQTGYWEFTKVIADSFRTKHTDTPLPDGEKAYLTGHSQGGARAALVSMYYEKKYSDVIETVTFGSVGGLCFSRDLYFTSGNMLDDVDPYTMHSQIRDYTHVLDIYGNFDYDPGLSCLYGKVDIANSHAKEYCEEVFGHQGADLMVAGNQGLLEDLNLEFSRCRYFTHSWYALWHDIATLSNPAFLGEDGETDIGCTIRTSGIPANDDRICPHTQLGTLDGCEDEMSCGACMVSTSTTGLFECEWCETSQRCMSPSSTWFEECKNSVWLQREDNCNATAAGGASMLEASPSTSLLLTFITFIGLGSMA